MKRKAGGRSIYIVGLYRMRRVLGREALRGQKTQRSVGLIIDAVVGRDHCDQKNHFNLSTRLRFSKIFL